MAARRNERKLTRIYDAPVQMLWDAWAAPKHAAKLAGPRGFPTATARKDLRAGGHWTYTMHGPDGTDFPNKAIDQVVERYARLVYDPGGNVELDRPPLLLLTVTFEELEQD